MYFLKIQLKVSAQPREFKRPENLRLQIVAGFYNVLVPINCLLFKSIEGFF